MKKNLSLGIIVILIGVIWLLSNLNVFSFSIIDVFIRSVGTLWPLFLIGLGITLLLKENKTVKLITWLIIFIIIILYGIFAMNVPNIYRHSPTAFYEFKIPMQ